MDSPFNFFLQVQFVYNKCSLKSSAVRYYASRILTIRPAFKFIVFDMYSLDNFNEPLLKMTVCLEILIVLNFFIDELVCADYSRPKPVGHWRKTL